LPLSNPRSTSYFLFLFEDVQTCSSMVGELCGCTKGRQEAHDYEMGGLQSIVEVIIVSHRLQRGVAHEVVVRLTRTRKKGARIHL
jgi:hypothetical protein